MLDDDGRPLTADECDKLADALLKEAATSPRDKREGLLSLAEVYRKLANLKRKGARTVN
jgi:hypothetical protein